MEDSPEQVLARLARHRDSLVRANRLSGVNARPRPTPDGGPPGIASAVVSAPSAHGVSSATRPAEPGSVPAPTPTEFIPPTPYSTSEGWRLAHSAVLVTLLGLLGALVACVLAIFAFALLEPAIAVGLVAAMALVGLGAAARRVPLALWWTAGALIGGALGLWS